MDWSPNVNPGMPEILLDGIDNDCNPLTPITGPACATVASAEMVLPPASTAPWLAASWLTCRMIARRRRLGESRPPTSPA
jgi:hypothetical protein